LKNGAKKADLAPSVGKRGKREKWGKRGTGIFNGGAVDGESP